MIYIVAVVIYLGLIIGIAIYKSFSVKTQDDFMVAGRRTSTFFLVGTLVCTWIGSGSLFGGAGLAFREGIFQLWMSAGAWIGIIVVFFIAGKVRKIAQYTVPDILEKRYNSSARVLGTLAVIIAYMTIAGYQFIGGGRLLSIISDGAITPFFGGLITCAVIILFTLLAGMVSIVSVDIFNGILMTGGIIIAIPLALSSVGGIEAVKSLPESHFSITGNNSIITILGIFFPTFLLLMGESSMYQKFFSAKGSNTARKAVVGMVIGVILVESLLAVLAIIGSSKYLTDPAFLNASGKLIKVKTETIILHLAFNDLPTWSGILLTVSASAIILSTGNTFLMIPSTNITRDIYQRFVNPDAGQKKVILFQRLMIILLGSSAFVVAHLFESILAMAFTAYVMIGAGITPALLASFLWRRVTVYGGVTSIVVGFLITIIFTLFKFFTGEPLLGFDAELIIIPAGTGSILSLIFVSLLTPKSPEAKWKPFWTK